MNILYIGDIMGDVGVQVVRAVLPALKKEKSLDLIVAQGENVTDGKGISVEDFRRLKEIGIDFVTGGNWSHYRQNILPALNDPNQPIIRPANYPEGTPGLGSKFINTQDGEVLIVSLLGKIVGKDADNPIDNPLKTIDAILDEYKKRPHVATIVNFHGDYSSEKRIIGYYLDGRVTAVVGDHWHVPTADAMILPGGTAHITDVGMCGSLHSSLGVSLSSVIPRWRDGTINKNELETSGPFQFNAVLITVNSKTGRADSIQPIQHVIN